MKRRGMIHAAVGAGRYLWHAGVRGVRIDAPPIFVVGCGHSGTSLLLAMLDAHPRIFGVPYESEIAAMPADTFAHRCRGFDRDAVARGKRRWCEKTPKHVRFIGEILDRAPGVRVVLIERDSRDVVASIKRRTGSLDDAISRWNDDNAAGRAYWGHDSVHRVKYEALAEDAERALRSVMAFLDEPFEPGQLRFHMQPRRYYAQRIFRPGSARGADHGAYRNWQINQPLFDGRGRWRELGEDEVERVTRETSGMLADIGYDPAVLPTPAS